MIPKVIHYCWFGGNPLPKDALKCIESWKKFCPDYEIKEWNESNFNFKECPYAVEAYSAKKWAFVSDFARFKILYENGGLYFDTDVELIKKIDSIVINGPFMGCERKIFFDNPNQNLGVAPGLGLGAAPGMHLYKNILDLYNEIHFINPDGSYNYKTVVEYVTELLQTHGLQNINEIQHVAGVNIYPKQYFNPMDLTSGKIKIEKETISIHHYSGSWLDKKGKRRGQIYRLLQIFLGKKNADVIRMAFSKNKK